MRGSMSPAVAIAVYDQLEQLNSLMGTFFTINDAAAQQLPNWMRVQDFLSVTECVGKPCIETFTQPAPPTWQLSQGFSNSTHTTHRKAVEKGKE